MKSWRVKLNQIKKKEFKTRVISTKRGIMDKMVNPHNMLDSSSPMKKRGKEREKPCKKRLSAMRKIILREREKIKQQRENDKYRNEDKNISTGDENENELKIIQDVSTAHFISNMNDITLIETDRKLQVAKMILHTRKFREYCNHLLSEEIDSTVTLLLSDLIRFQNRLYEKDPIKARMKKRMVQGLREVTKHIAFHFNFPVPVIAAGLDFLGLKIISTLLRSSGAFFIRRQFADDRLYWTIFLVYVQTHILGGEAPIEFFVEGTRSRTAKSLIPKLGLLQVACELFFTGRVSDITIVPISISYDRTLEEVLYAYELLGVPKPKESTKGLFKARKILQQNFGNVYVHFGDPISLRDFSNGRVDRSVHNLQPLFQSTLSIQERLACSDLANHIIKSQQHNLLLSPFPLICLVAGHIDFKEKKLSQDELFNYVYWLSKLVNKTGAAIIYDSDSLQQSVIYHLKLHSNIFHITDSNNIEIVSLTENSTNNAETLRISIDIIKEAIPAMIIYHYSNQTLQLLIQYAMVTICLVSSSDYSLTKEAALEKYEILLKLLSKEFVFEREKTEEEFNVCLRVLQEENIIEVGKLLIIADFDKAKFLADLLIPFLQCYGIVCEQFLNGKIKGGTSKEISQNAQRAIEILLHKNKINDYKSLSLDMINNCIIFMANINVLWKEKRNNTITFTPILPEIATVLCNIELFLPGHQISEQPVWNKSAKSNL